MVREPGLRDERFQKLKALAFSGYKWFPTFWPSLKAHKVVSPTNSVTCGPMPVVVAPFAWGAGTQESQGADVEGLVFARGAT